MNPFNILQNIIRQRRSIKPTDLNGKKIDSTLIHQLLDLANWAPTHGRTEPWRFVVYENHAVQKFCADHANLYKENTSVEKFTEAKYEKLYHLGDTVSHIIAVYMKRSEGHAIPYEEEFAAVAASIQNILLGAASLDIAVLWSTGGMTHTPAMKNYFSLSSADTILGILYMGYTNLEVKDGKRNIPLADKVDWHS